MPQTDSGISRSCGIDRETVKRWRLADGWSEQRAEFLAQCRSDAARATAVATATARQTARVLSAVRRREILESIAEDPDGKPRDRIAAILADARLDPDGREDGPEADQGIVVLDGDSEAWLDG